MTLPPRQPNQTERDLAIIVGGNFTPDALGPEHGRIRERLRAAPAAYLDAFERLFLARGANAPTLARLRPEAFLAQLQSVAPDRVRTITESGWCGTTIPRSPSPIMRRRRRPT